MTPQHRLKAKPRTRRRVLLGAIGLATATVLFAASAPAVQVAPPTTGYAGFVAPGGTIKFELVGGAPSVDFYPPSGSTASPIMRPLAVTSKCAVTNLTSSATIGSKTYLPVSDVLKIAVTGTTSAVSFYNNDLGVYGGSAGCNANAGKLSLGQTMTVSPGMLLTGQTFLSAYPVVGQHNQAGLAWTASKAGTTVKSGTNPLQGPAFSGNSSASNDNTVVPIDPTDTSTTPPTDHPFDTVALKATTPGNANAIIDLSPGDVPGDAASIFNLGKAQDFTVDCSGHNTVTSGSNGSTLIDWASFARQPNGYNPAKDPTCKLIGVTVRVQPTQALIGGSLHDVVLVDNTTTAADGTPQQLRAYLTIEWRVPRYANGVLRPEADIDAQMQRQINYSLTDDTQWQPVQWCGHLTDPSNGAIDPATADGKYPLEPEHPAGQAWCLTSDERHLEGDSIIQTQIYHGAGDPRLGPG